MPVLRLILNGDNAFPDLAERRADVIHLADDASIAVAGLEGGMKSGRASIMLRIDLPDGKVVLAETSMRLFLLAAAAFRARYGDQEA